MDNGYFWMAVANFSLFTFHFSLFYRIFVAEYGLYDQYTRQVDGSFGASGDGNLECDA